jgi:hypothetical protein
MNERELIAIKMLLTGAVSGKLREWPYLCSALDETCEIYSLNDRAKDWTGFFLSCGYKA